jgi:serine/threonine protein kinase
MVSLDKPSLQTASKHSLIFSVCAGYLRITDFGIARVWREDNAQDTSGTPGYMAPEVMCRQNHTTSVDFFAVGVMAYECMFGRVSIFVEATFEFCLTSIFS